MMDDETTTKEWVKVGHQANGNMSVTVTLMRDGHTVRWAEKVYPTEVKKGLKLARTQAAKTLRDIAEAMAELEAIA